MIPTKKSRRRMLGWRTIKKEPHRRSTRRIDAATFGSTGSDGSRDVGKDLLAGSTTTRRTVFSDHAVLMKNDAHDQRTSHRCAGTKKLHPPAPSAQDSSFPQPSSLSLWNQILHRRASDCFWNHDGTLHVKINSSNALADCFDSVARILVMFHSLTHASFMHSCIHASLLVPRDRENLPPNGPMPC